MVGSDARFSEVWRVRSSVCRGLGVQILSFPRFGGSDPQFSKVWRGRSSVLRGLEGQILSFLSFLVFDEEKGPRSRFRKKWSFCVILHLRFSDRIRRRFFRFLGTVGSDPRFSEVWSVRSWVFPGLEVQIPSFSRFGVSDPQCSKVWRVRSLVSQVWRVRASALQIL